MTCFVEAGSGYPLTTAVLCKARTGHGCRKCGTEKAPGRGRWLCVLCQPRQKPTGTAVCYLCKSTPILGKGARYCEDCRPIALSATATRKQISERRREGKPCRKCGRPKPHGRGRTVCDHCAAGGGVQVRICERCPRPSRSPQAKLCAECKAAARAENAAYKRRWNDDHGQPSGGKGSADVRRMGKRLQRERYGHEVRPAPPILDDHGRRVDTAEFPSLPTAPLAAKINALIRRTALDAPYGLELAAEIRGEGGGLRPIEQAHRGDAPSVRQSVCERIGIPPRRLYNWERGIERSTGFDVADRIVTRAGWLWWSVWESGEDYELARRAFEGE